MSVLTSGRTEPCKDNVGGLKEVWLTNFIPYNQNLIIGYRDMLVTSFPTTLFYEYEGVQKSFSETFNERYYEQEIKLRLIKQDLSTAGLLGVLQKNLVRAVVVDNLNRIRVAGIHNGLDIDLNAQQGGSKASFNGYELTLTGLEPFKAPFISAFPGSGFEQDGVDLGCLLASSDRPASLQDKVSSCNIVQ